MSRTERWSDETQQTLIFAVCLALCVGSCSALVAYQEASRARLVETCLRAGQPAHECQRLAHEPGTE